MELNIRRLMWLFIVAIGSGCTHNNSIKTDPVHLDASPVKNIILVIGDGMGPQQIGLLEEFAERSSTSVYADSGTALAKFANAGVIGLSRHSPYDALVVDSACSATQLATGIAARSEMIGLDANGNPVTTVLEKAKSHGKSTGLVSDTRITHATPAAFASHQTHRSKENEIAVDLLKENDVDVMLSAGLRYFLPHSDKISQDTKDQISAMINEPSLSLTSKRLDDKNLLAQAKQQGYALAFNRSQLKDAQGDKLLGLFASSQMMDGIVHKKTRAKSNRTEPSLPEMTAKAISILSKNEKGFFLMVEAGQIDWASHSNDAGTLLHELIKFDETLEVIFDWAKSRTDTLVVITADHETGGFGFSYSRKDLPAALSLTGSAFSKDAYKPQYNFGDVSNLDKLYAQEKSLYSIWREAKAKNKKEKSTKSGAQNVFEALNKYSAFDISLAEAEKIIQREPNDYRVEGHKYLGKSEFPKVNDFKEFYVYGDDVHVNLMGRALSRYQNVVWSTGTHTHTPVPVIAWGPKNVIESFGKFQHHTDIGKLLHKAVN